MTEHLVYDWKSLPYVTLSNQWYNQTANDAYTVAERQYFAVSDLTFPVQQHFRILFNLYSERITDIMKRVVAWKNDPNYNFSATGNMHYDIFNAGRVLFECYGSDPALRGILSLTLDICLIRNTMKRREIMWFGLQGV